MAPAPRLTFVCLSSYFKGNRFLQRCQREGCHVILITVEDQRHADWARDAIDEFFVMPSFADRRAVLNGLAYLVRTRRIDRIVALDDYDVELAAFAREHFRIAGMGETTMRYFRDKLGMRTRARAVDALLTHYMAHIARDFQAVLPPAAKATA